MIFRGSFQPLQLCDSVILDYTSYSTSCMLIIKYETEKKGMGMLKIFLRKDLRSVTIFNFLLLVHSNNNDSRTLFNYSSRTLATIQEM